MELGVKVTVAYTWLWFMTWARTGSTSKMSICCRDPLLCTGFTENRMSHGTLFVLLILKRALALRPMITLLKMNFLSSSPYTPPSMVAFSAFCKSQTLLRVKPHVLVPGSGLPLQWFTTYLTVVLPKGQVLDNSVLLKDWTNVLHIDGGCASLGNDSVGDSMGVMIWWIPVRDINR